jgi:hypothetical protein
MIRRHPGTLVMLEVDGDGLTLADPFGGERRDVIEGWIQRHGGG